jgi:uncharacterized membrane protein
MKPSSFFSRAVTSAILLGPLMLLLIVYQKLPATVALHFDAGGEPDRFGGKSELIWVILILTIVNIGTHLLVTNLHTIDPKKAARLSEANTQKIASAVVLLLSFVSVLIILAARSSKFELHNFFLPTMGVFFAYLGNVMYNVKPNYFVGIRTPWTLEDADTWRKTHHFTGKLWFGAGVIITIATLLVPLVYKLPVFLTIIAVIVVIPVIYSFTYYKEHKGKES